MNKEHEFKITQLVKITDMGVEFKELIEQNTFTKQLFDRSNELKQTITEYVSAVDVSVKSLWHDKSEASDHLIHVVIRDCRALKSYGLFNKFNVFADLVNFTKTDLKRMGDQELIAHVRMLIDVMLSNDAEAKLAGVSMERFDVLNAALNKLVALSEQPESARTQIKLTNDDLDNALKEFGELLIALTDHMAGVYEGVRQDFYDAFIIAINVTKPYYHKLSLRGHITDENGDPLRYVRISVDGGEDVVKKAKKGGYWFKYLAPGKHVLVFKREGYITQIHTIDILPLKTLTLDIQLMPVVSETTDVDKEMEVEAD